MTTKTHTFWLTLAIVLAYFWASSLFLTPYSLQIFALSAVFYFAYKKLTSPTSWNFLPQRASIEMIFVTFALLTLLGGTGNLDSIFYPLTYIHLFLLVFFSETWTAIIITCQIILFHYALTSLSTPSQISHLVTIPIVLVFFLFAKDRYTAAKNEKIIINEEEIEIENIKKELEDVTHQRDELSQKISP